MYIYIYIQFKLELLCHLAFWMLFFLNISAVPSRSAIRQVCLFTDEGENSAGKGQVDRQNEDSLAAK